MFDRLDKYPLWNHFFLTPNDRLNEVCNAPKNAMGVYIVYALAHGNIEMVYIGSSGRISAYGTVKARNGGLFQLEREFPDHIQGSMDVFR